jgi:hypothetical protein
VRRLTDQEGEAAAERAPGQHQFGALPTGDDAVGLSWREPGTVLLARRDVTVQRTKTWKESPDPERDTKLDCIVEEKDRFGPTACVTVASHLHYSRFMDLAHT